MWVSVLVCTLLVLLFGQFVTIWYLIGIILYLLGLITIVEPSLRIIIGISFGIGFVSDFFFNIVSLQFKNNLRFKALRIFFDYLGWLPAALLGGGMAAFMVIDIFYLMDVTNLWDIGWGILFSILVPLVWGTLFHYAYSFSSYRIFYDANTLALGSPVLGWIVSRFWDIIAFPVIISILWGLGRIDSRFYPIQ